jgi:DNA-binding transcriptional LysR family regulator
MDLLRHLRFFVTVAETRHFGQAATALGMTQPPLSQGIQRLERELGVRLFDRDARGVRITSVGTSLLPRAEDLLVAAAELRDHAEGWTEPDVVRVGLASDLDDLAPALVETVAAAGHRLTPVVDGTTVLADQLLDGALDVAVLRHPSVVDGTRPREVRTLPTRLVVPPGAGGQGSRLDDDESVHLSQVRLPLVVPLRRHHPAAHDQLVDALRREGHDGTTVEEADPVTRAALVAAGRGVRLTLDRRAGRPLYRDPLPLRFRVVLPTPADRRPHLDIDTVVDALEASLT